MELFLSELKRVDCIKSIFKDIKLHNSKVRVGDGRELEVNAIGEIVAKIKSKNENKSITIENALYVSDFSKKALLEKSCQTRNEIKQKESKINKENKVNMEVKNKPKKIVKFSEYTKYDRFMSRSKNSLEHLERFERDGIMVRKKNSQNELQSSSKEKRRKNNLFSSKDFQEDYSITIL
ncbi:unnamed protein product [Brachionus calyciflorus]|uniref:Retrovirus-related Pol polyprotein from transposon TNT 1-94-like beta-barrel domain-containing protein n=1 Tax=Brachionus calyciflorus TaxID=104777 RepID=A0A813TXP9_9BILA|nr:unnamed protein product [Brachionus calyciflorus]